MNDLFPIFMKLASEPVLVVGGGSVAEVKIHGLLDANAAITVIAPEVSPVIERLSAEEKLKVLKHPYATGDVAGFSLVIGATDDPVVQWKIHEDAKTNGIPVNIVDVPDLCTFYCSSVFRKGDLKIAVSTNGKSPTLGKVIRDRIQGEFSEGYPDLLEALGTVRPDVQSSFPDYESRKRYYAHVVKSELERLHQQREMEQGSAQTLRSGRGKVYLVGAGPGDADLITLRGLRALQTAEVVLYDALLDEKLLEHSPGSCEKIYVGKRADAHCASQDEINHLMVRKAKEGKNVVRLKGGDPFIFGRGGEELEALRREGIDVEVVPGITAGTGVPSALGIPLTHRDYASSVAFVTGHSQTSGSKVGVDWSAVARMDTIVVYMGTKNAEGIVNNLLHNGLDPEKPIAVVLDGVSPRMQIIRGTMKTILDKIRNVPLNAPGLIIVGDVAGNPVTMANSMEIAVENTWEKETGEEIGNL